MLKGQTNVEKKLFQFLIAEKLMAIEIESYLSNKYANNLIEGYKEQLMRESFWKMKFIIPLLLIH